MCSLAEDAAIQPRLFGPGMFVDYRYLSWYFYFPCQEGAPDAVDLRRQMFGMLDWIRLAGMFFHLLIPSQRLYVFSGRWF